MIIKEINEELYWEFWNDIYINFRNLCDNIPRQKFVKPIQTRLILSLFIDNYIYDSVPNKTTEIS